VRQTPAHFHQQRLQLLVRGARNQGLVERVDHLLVIGDFTIDVRLVERSPREGLQMSKVFVAVGLQALAGRVVLRRNVELAREVSRGPVHAGVVGDHQPRKRFDLVACRPGGRELACIDVDLVGGQDDRRNLGVSDALCGHTGGGNQERTCERDDDG
jgi:hypothetical protein